jgi:hypothetical protein
MYPKRWGQTLTPTCKELSNKIVVASKSFCIHSKIFSSWTVGVCGLMDVTAWAIYGLLLPNPNCVIACKACNGRARARASTNASRPSITITTSIEAEEPSQPSCCDMFASDVAFALVSRWLPCTLYPPASQAGATRPALCEALRGARSWAARW